MIFRKKKTKKLRTRPFWGNRLQLLKWKKYLRVLTIVSLVGACFFAGSRIYNKTMGSATYTITKIEFAPESVNALRSIDLYTFISNELKGRNYYRTKRLHRKSIIRDIQFTHPLVKDLTLEHTAPGTIYLTITFQQPALLWQTPDAYFVSYREDIYSIGSDSILTSGMMPIQLPRFSSGRSDINGIYREVSEEELVKYVEQITTQLQKENISELIYQPGGKRLFVTYKGKRVYFNLQKDILIQLEKLLALENHRDGFANIRTIDLGSRDEAVVQ